MAAPATPATSTRPNRTRKDIILNEKGRRPKRAGEKTEKLVRRQIFAISVWSVQRRMARRVNVDCLGRV